MERRYIYVHVLWNVGWSDKNHYLETPLIKKNLNIINTRSYRTFSNSGHVGWRLGLPDTILEGDHPRTIPPKLVLNGQVVLEENIF
jgi:hypothetical protein